MKHPEGYNATEEWSFPPSTATILQEGQMWFNSSSSALKGYGTAAGIPAATWASGGSLNTAREVFQVVHGTQTQSMASGGDPPGSPKLLTNNIMGQLDRSWMI